MGFDWLMPCYGGCGTLGWYHSAVLWLIVCPRNGRCLDSGFLPTVIIRVHERLCGWLDHAGRWERGSELEDER